MAMPYSLKYSLIFHSTSVYSYCEISEYFGIPIVKQLLIVMIDSSTDIGVKEIMYMHAYAKH